MPRLIDQYPDIAGLALLASVDAAGSVGAAAARFGISQPAASQRIRALERSMGITLIERRSTGSRLTAAGSLVLDWAEPLLTAAAEFGAVAGGLSAAPRRVRIAASLTVADYLLPKWLGALRHVLPDASVAVQANNSEAVMRAVRDSAADIGFVEGPEAPRGLRSRAVTEDVLAVVVGTSHPWARRTTPVSVEDLADAALVLREENSGTRRVLDRALAEHGITLQPVMELGSTTAIKQAIRDGAFASVISRMAIEAELESGQLIEVPAAGIDLRRRIRAIWRPTAPPQGVTGALLAIATSA